MSSRQEALLERHLGLEAEISEEKNRPQPDEIRLAQLKKEKLRLKDQIAGHEVLTAK